MVFDDSAQHMFETGGDPLLAIDVNIPSINLPTMPGSVTVTRTATNVTKKAYNFKVNTEAPDGSTITVTPKSGKIKAGSPGVHDHLTSNAPRVSTSGRSTWSRGRNRRSTCPWPSSASRATSS